jgi:hypothetical protein
MSILVLGGCVRFPMRIEVRASGHTKLGQIAQLMDMESVLARGKTSKSAVHLRGVK